MAKKIEDRLISGWASDEKRTLLDLATGGRAKTSEDSPSLLGIAKSAYGSLQEAGARQQEELNRPITVSVGGRDIDLGVSQADLFGYVTGALGKGTKFSKTDVFSVNPSQAQSVLKALPGKVEDNLGKLLKDPGKVVSDISKTLKGKYHPKFILQVLRQHYREMIGDTRRRTLERQGKAVGRKNYKTGQEWVEYPKPPIPKSLRGKEQKDPGIRGLFDEYDQGPY